MTADTGEAHITEQLSRPRVALIGAFGPVQMACIRAWNDCGIRPIFLHISAGRSLRFTKRALAGYERISPELIDDPVGDEKIRAILAGHDCDAVVAVSYNQAAWLHGSVCTHGGKPVACVPAPDTIAFLDAKSPQMELARRVGLDVADWWLLTAATDETLVPDDAFPIVLRPDTSDSAEPMFKVIRCDDRVALAAFLARQKSASFRLVAQPFVQGPNLVVHGARNIRGQCLRHQGFLVDYKFEGVTQRLRPTPITAALSDACREFVTRAGLTGVYHFEFLMGETAGRILFLEVNGRLGGTTGKVYWCGYPEPVHLLQSFDILPWPDAGMPAAIRNRIVTNDFSLLKRLLLLARGRRDVMDYPDRGSLSLILRLFGGLLTWTDEIFSLRHWRTTLDYYLGMFRE